MTAELLRADVMTSEEAAELLGVSRVTIRTMVAKGRLSPLRKGTRPLLFEAAEVHDLEVSRRPPAERERHARLRALWLAS